MPKVLRIINRFNLGGPTYNAAYLTKYLAPEFETILIGGLKDDSEESSEFILKNLDIRYTILPEMRRSINPLNDLRAYQSIKKIIKQIKPDIVHTHAAKAGAIGRRAAFACRVPVTVHTFHGHVFHSYFNRMQTAAVKAIEKRLASRTTAIVALSEKQKSELVSEHRIAPPEKVHVIPLGFDLSRFSEQTDAKRQQFRERYKLKDETAIGIVGRLVPVKNHAFFLEAIYRVCRQTQKKIKAFIVGDGEEKGWLEGRTRELGLQDCVVFTSWEKEIDKVYPGLDIVCLTSYNEGTPVSLIEAQAARKPIVATNAGGIENAVIPGETALLSPVGDLDGFSKNLRMLIDTDSLQYEMSQKGPLYVNSRFNHRRLVSEMASLYNSLLK